MERNGSLKHRKIIYTDSIRKDKPSSLKYEVLVYADNYTENLAESESLITLFGNHERKETWTFHRQGKVTRMEIETFKNLGSPERMQIVPKGSGHLWFLEKILVVDLQNSNLFEFGPSSWIDDSSPSFNFQLLRKIEKPNKREHASDPQLDILNCQIILDSILSQNQEELERTLSKRRSTNVNVPLHGTEDRLLHAAVCTGNVNIVKALLSHADIDVNVHGTQGLTPLHTASSLTDGNLIVTLLVEAGANIEARDESGCTPLALAVLRGNLQSVQAILSNGARFDTTNDENKNILHLAVTNPELLHFLLQKQEAKPLLKRFDKVGCTPIHYAARESAEAVRLILQYGGDICDRDGYGRYAIHYTSDTVVTGCLKELVHGGAVVNCEDDFKNRPLHLACSAGNAAMVKALIKFKASVSQNIKGESPLHLAAKSGSLDCVTELLNVFSSSLDMIDCEGDTALHVSARQGHVQLVKALLDQGCRVSYNWHRQNVLDVAMVAGNEDVVLLLASRPDWARFLRLPNSPDGHPQLPEIMQKMPDAAEKFLDQFVTQEEEKQEKDSNPLIKLFDHARKKGLRIKTIFERLDTNNSGSLSRDEIRQGLQMMGTDFQEEEVDQIITTFDRNGDGEINLRELYDKLPQGNTSSFRQKKFQRFRYDFRYLKGHGDNTPLKALIKMDAVENATYVRCMHHPVVEKLVAVSWQKFGVYVYFLNFFTFVVFLCLLTSLIVMETDIHYLNITHNLNSTSEKYAEVLHGGNYHTALATIVMATILIQMIKELCQLKVQGITAYMEFDNFIEWALYITSFLFTLGALGEFLPKDYFSDDVRMQLGSVAVFLAWLDFVLFLELIPVFGIYVHMIKILLGTLLKVIWILLTFVIAFGLAFYALKNSITMFQTAGVSIITVGLMSFGELGYHENFINRTQQYDLGVVMLIIFCLLVVIILNNLLIGLAVGDVEAVRHIAQMKQQIMSIELYLHLSDSWLAQLLKSRVSLDEYFENREIRKKRDVWEMLKPILEIGLNEHENEEANADLSIHQKLSELCTVMKNIHQRLDAIEERCDVRKWSERAQHHEQFPSCKPFPQTQCYIGSTQQSSKESVVVAATGNSPQNDESKMWKPHKQNKTVTFDSVRTRYLSGDSAHTIHEEDVDNLHKGAQIANQKLHAKTVTSDGQNSDSVVLVFDDENCECVV
ncbi:transient receptor potential cation channel subfamily A member 1-like [Lingula anatina]|uniref:Transient receptor potential cation channel subfamily A member 1-like n=1 Tax=Lingula anatina TaxID=7574 RepID=A0A1S3IV57_LINAN|nr:transient receptor potential cation channel subfamily A member 1-like [Lingula anatina]|eukprot:XP_013402082.1 transient receptor potential cation channel subfamily A member 1-like [Lingula anatina]